MRRLRVWAALAFIAALPVALARGASDVPPSDETPAAGDAATFARAARLLQSHCAMPACHAGPGAVQGLRLETSQIYRSAVNVRARTDSRYLRVDPGAPDRSLLLLKLLPSESGHYRGPRMPMGMAPLTDEEIAVIADWISSFPPDTWGKAEVPEAPAHERTFQDRYLANLPTTESLGARTLEFRFSHRFKGAAADAGSQELYGLDTGAWVSLEMAYGATDRLDFGLRRTNLQEDYEAYAKCALLRQRQGGSPVSLSLRVSASDARAKGVANEWRYGAQAILSARLGAVSLMLVPTYVTDTNSLDPADHDDTAAVGAGIEWRVSRVMSLTGEYLRQTDGVMAPYQGASIGASFGTARHVFHILLTNTSGAHTDLYAPGGDLDVSAGEYRIGFNISRTWSLGR